MEEHRSKTDPSSSSNHKQLFYDNTEDSSGGYDANYTSVFLQYTNEVIARCTPDIEFETRIQFRLEALRKVYEADFVSVYAISRIDGFVDTIFSSDEPNRAQLEPRFDLKPLLPLGSLSAFKEDELICFALNDSGVLLQVDRSKIRNSDTAITAVPIICADRRMWAVVCVNPKRFVEYTLSLTLGADAIKTELSKRIMLEEIAGGDTPFLQTRMPQNSIYVRMLGQFTMRTPKGKLDCYNLGGKQCTVLLAKLLLNPRRLIPARELIDMLSPLSVASNPSNALKSTLFRIRKASNPILDGGEELISSHHGSYTLNQNYQFILDTSRFELFSSMAKRRGVSDIERMALLEYAIKQYNGDLLPGLESDLTILGQITYYRLIFENSLEQYLELLLSTEQYQRIFKTIAHISEQHYSSPRIYRILIDALMKMGYEDIAVSYFNNMRRTLPRQALIAIEQEFASKYGSVFGGGRNVFNT